MNVNEFMKPDEDASKVQSNETDNPIKNKWRWEWLQKSFNSGGRDFLVGQFIRKG